MAVLAKRLQGKDEFAICLVCQQCRTADTCTAVSSGEPFEPCRTASAARRKLHFFCHTSLGQFRFSSAFGTLTRTTFPSPEKSRGNRLSHRVHSRANAFTHQRSLLNCGACFWFELWTRRETCMSEMPTDGRSLL